MKSLPKLMAIALSGLNGATLLKAVCSPRDYIQMLQENDELKALDSFLNNHRDLQLSDPIMVILNDIIEKKFEDEKPDKGDEDVMEAKMEQVKKVVLESANASLHMSISLAYFKRVAKLYANEVILKITQKDDFKDEYPSLKEILESFFDERAQDNKDKLYPLAIYLIKLMHSKKDMLRENIKELLLSNPWIKDYINNLADKVDNKDVKFPFISDPQFKQHKALFGPSQGRIEELFKETATDPLKRLACLIQSFEVTYLKQHSILADQSYLKFLNQKKEERSQAEAVGSYSKSIDEQTRAFFKSVYSGRLVKAEGKDKVFDQFHT